MLQRWAPGPGRDGDRRAEGPAGRRVITSPNRSLNFLIQPTTAAPAGLTATLTWRMAVPAGVARMTGTGHDPAAGSVALATLTAPVEELYCPHAARTLPLPSAPSATGPVNDMPVPLTTAAALHPAAAVHTEASITVSAGRCADQARTADPSGRITTAGEAAVWAAGDTAAALDHPADGVRTLALTRPLPVHATTAVPDACPAVTRAGEGVPGTVASASGADQVVPAPATPGIRAPVTATPVANTTAGNTRRNLPGLESVNFICCRLRFATPA